ncbi:MAG: 3-deoxy-D-manno-octulosonic acid transferase, partial [Chlamydiia bacterium]|nr:3-deoxy-D-manno-octulosonic acid transferase [Chlamydiia bacterium]
DKAAQEPDPLNFKEPVLVIGSTHAPEEKLFLDVVSKVWENTPNLKVYIVPRHPERFDQVAKLIENKGVAYTRSSKKETGSEKLVLVDEMGKL